MVFFEVSTCSQTMQNSMDDKQKHDRQEKGHISPAVSKCMQLILHTIDEHIMDRGINKEDDAVNEKIKHTGGDLQADKIDKTTDMGTKNDTNKGNDGIFSFRSSDGDNSTDLDKSTNTSETWRNIKSSDTHFGKSRETDVKRGIGKEADIDAENDGSSNWSYHAEYNSSKENSSSKFGNAAKPTTISDFETDMCIEINSNLNEDDIDAERDKTRNDADIRMSSNLETNKGIDNNNSNKDNLKNIERHGKEVDLNERRDIDVDLGISKSLGVSLGKNTYTDQNDDDVGTIDDRSIGTGINNTKILMDRNNAAASTHTETQPPDECSPIKGNTPAPKTEEIENTTMAEKLKKTTPIGTGAAQRQQPLISNNQLQLPGLDLESLLPHEGQRWALLRDKMMTTPQLEQYVKRTQGDSPWSADEAFISFFLDRLEMEELIPMAEVKQVAPKTKKKTRRKGQPRKYERIQNYTEVKVKEPPKKTSKVATDFCFVEDEFEDDDILSMDDNPDDLDYEPVSIIRYKKTASRKLPRRSSTKRMREEMEVSLDTPDEDNFELIKPPKKLPKTKNKKQVKITKPKPEGPLRKRGRPKKDPNAPPKVPGKKGRPRLSDEQRMAKRKAYNETRTRMRLEVLRSSLPKRLRCKTCDEQFTETEAVTLHYFEVHRQQRIGEADRLDPTSAFNMSQVTDIAVLLRECPKCKEYVENMTRHNRTHQTRNFICEECGKFFVTRMRLKLHKRIHQMDRTGERLHCDKCDKSYRCISSLQRHQLIHGGKKTFICDQCGKDFFNSVRLRVHRAVHMKEKPYKCPDCGRGFTQLTNLRSHQRVHTGVKPYKCDICNDSFTHKVSLKTHQKKKHGIDWWKENGIQVEERKPSNKKSADKKPSNRGMVEMKTIVDQHHVHVNEGMRNYEFVSNLITHGSKTYAQLERKTNASEAFHTMINPYDNPWQS